VNIFTGILSSNSYYQVNLEEPNMLHVFQLAAFFPGNLFPKNMVLLGSLEITVKNEFPSENILA
jgi:hypothetical protein